MAADKSLMGSARTTALRTQLAQAITALGGDGLVRVHLVMGVIWPLIESALRADAGGRETPADENGLREAIAAALNEIRHAFEDDGAELPEQWQRDEYATEQLTVAVRPFIAPQSAGGRETDGLVARLRDWANDQQLGHVVGTRSLLHEAADALASGGRETPQWAAQYRAVVQHELEAVKPISDHTEGFEKGLRWALDAFDTLAAVATEPRRTNEQT